MNDFLSSKNYYNKLFSSCSLMPRQPDQGELGRGGTLGIRCWPVQESGDSFQCYSLARCKFSIIGSNTRGAWWMVSGKIKVSQNFGQISRISQSHLLRGSERLVVLNFLQSHCGVWISISQSKDHKKSRSHREKRWSRRLTKFRIYHSPPLTLVMDSVNFFDYTETVEEKLSWMEVLNAATESQTETQDKFDKGRKSVRQRLNRRVSHWSQEALNRLMLTTPVFLIKIMIV